MAELRSRVAQVEAERDAQWHAGESMRHSTSWRITAPLRAAMDAVRRRRAS